MSMAQSRAQSPEKDLIESGLYQTKPSTAFKSTGRNTKANWANRFNKDFYDLDYDIKYNLVKGKSQMSNYKDHLKNKVGRNDRERQSQSRSHSKGVRMDKYKNRFELMKMNKTLNPEKYVIVEQKKYSTLQSQGLCKFEFEKTIGGKMIHKSNHHMHFEYQTGRSKNLNPVWYNADNQLQMQKMFKSINKNKVSRCHDFASYSARKVFEPREELDKFYDTKKPHSRATTRTIKETVRMDRISGRAEERPKESTKLAYKEYEAKKKIMARTLSYEIGKGKRQLEFGRQVISPERGCYR